MSAIRISFVAGLSHPSLLLRPLRGMESGVTPICVCGRPVRCHPARPSQLAEMTEAYGLIRARSVVRADVSSHGSRIDTLKEICKRAVATPAIRHAANLLVDLALQIPGATNPAETGAGRIGI